MAALYDNILDAPLAKAKPVTRTPGIAETVGSGMVTGAPVARTAPTNASVIAGLPVKAAPVATSGPTTQAANTVLGGFNDGAVPGLAPVSAGGAPVTAAPVASTGGVPTATQPGSGITPGSQSFKNWTVDSASPPTFAPGELTFNGGQYLDQNSGNYDNQRGANGLAAGWGFSDPANASKFGGQVDNGNLSIGGTEDAPILMIKNGKYAGMQYQYQKQPDGSFAPVAAKQSQMGTAKFGEDVWMPIAMMATAGAGAYLSPAAAAGEGAGGIGAADAGYLAAADTAGGLVPAYGTEAGYAAGIAAPAGGAGVGGEALATGTAPAGTGSSTTGVTGTEAGGMGTTPAATTPATTSANSNLYRDLLTRVGVPLAVGALSSSNSGGSNAGVSATGEQNRQLSGEIAGMGRDQIQRSKEWDAKYGPIFDQIMQGFVTDSNTARDRGAQAWDVWQNTYLPVAKKSAEDAMNYDSAANTARREGLAGATIDNAFTAAEGERQRNLARSGVTADSGRGVGAGAEYAKAAARASAINGERTATMDKAIQLRRDQAGLGTAEQAVASTQQQIAGANRTGAASTIATGTNASNSNRNNAVNFLSTAVGAGNSAAQILQAQQDAENARRADQNQMWGTIAGGIANWAGNQNWGG